MKGAFDAYREAERIVGGYPTKLAAEADRARKAWFRANSEANIREDVSGTKPGTEESRLRRERAKASIAELDLEMESTAAEALAAADAWRGAMVRQLLRPAPVEHVPVVDSRSVEQVPSGPQDEPFNNAPTPLTTGDIAYCFDGLRWSDMEWRKPLGDKPKWLSECVVIPGQRGVSETRWNPVLIGAALLQQGHVSDRNVRAKFQTVDLLKPWLDAWKTYEADNLDTV